MCCAPKMVNSRKWHSITSRQWRAMHRRRISPLNQATRLSSREEHAMKKWQCIWTAMFLALALGVGWAQGDSGQQPADSTQPPAASASPAPAFGQDNPPPQTDDNPPLSGL